MPANTRALLEKIKALPDHRSCSRRCVNATKSSTSAIRALTRAVTATRSRWLRRLPAAIAGHQQQLRRGYGFATAHTCRPRGI
jgi:hypothetical protein